MKVKLSMVLDINGKNLEDIKKLEHHIENLVDLDSWPEIINVSSVKVSEKFDDKEE